MIIRFLRKIKKNTVKRREKKNGWNADGDGKIKSLQMS